MGWVEATWVTSVSLPRLQQLAEGESRRRRRAQYSGWGLRTCIPRPFPACHGLVLHSPEGCWGWRSFELKLSSARGGCGRVR